MPRCNSEAMSMHLEEIAFHVAPGAHAVLLLDQAGWHGSAELLVPPNITLMPLPPRCPELNPVERLWDILKDELCNRVYDGICALEDAACQALQPFIREAHRVRSLVGDGWLHAQANAS